MNGFIAQQEKNRHWPSIKPADDVMGYHTAADIPNYWDYARHFVLEDHMFEPVGSWSLPAHLYPKTDGRPDPRPNVRESVPQLGDVLAALDFSQAPRQPLMLPVHPKTDLIEP